MSKQELAQGIIELWEQYATSGWRVYQPTMTGFIDWLKQYDEMPPTNHAVKPERTPEELADFFEAEEMSKTASLVRTVNSEFQKLPSVAKAPLRSALTKADVKDIRKLYEQGYSLARIRQELGLSVTLNRIETVVNKPW